MGTKAAWTDERRARQAEIIRSTKPWEKAIGPVTEEGKAISSRNAQLPDAFRRCREARAKARLFVLALLDRERLPKGTADGFGKR